MARTADLGWLMARCDADSLELLEPASEASPAASMTVQGLANIIALRDLIEDMLSDHAAQQEMAKDCPPGD